MATFDNGIYWHDYVEKDDEKLDLKIQVTNPCKEANIFFKKPIVCSDVPTCIEQEFDVLFFDWGGMSLGNSLMQHFCHYILKHAEEHPNKFFVMVSAFTAEAMEDAIKEFGKDKPFNIFLCISDFSDWLKKYEEE